MLEALPATERRERTQSSRPLVARVFLWFAVVGAIPVVAAIAFITAVWPKLPNEISLRQALAAERQCVRFVDDRGVYLATSCPIGTETGEFTPLDSLPKYFIDDLQFYEDQQFLRHYGVSPTGLARAVLGHRGGGSTLTMQVARLLMSYPDRTIYRKALELVCALKLEKYLRKGEILELYVNRSRFGEGSRVGIAAAARRYFSISPSQLSRPQAILLISFLSRPARADVRRTEERERVYGDRLRRLRAAGKISDGAFEALRPTPLFASSDGASSYDGLFVARAEQEFDRIAAGIPAVRRDGAIIETTLDRARNEAVAIALRRSLACCPSARASAVVMNPKAEIVAYTTERASRPGDQDLVAANATMPASQIKAVLYTAFIDSLFKQGATPEQVLAYPLPTSYRLGPRRIVRDSGPPLITLREAVVRSRNAPAYWIANDFLRPQQVSHFADRVGLHLPAIRSIGIGQTGVAQLDLATAYNAILLRSGSYRRASFVRQIRSLRGDTVLYSAVGDVIGRSAASPQATQMVKQLLREVVYREAGTAHRVISASPELLDFDLAAKTGTSSGSAWCFRGMTGVIGESATFSVLIQGPGLPSAGVIAAPAAAALVRALAGDAKVQSVRTLGAVGARVKEYGHP